MSERIRVTATLPSDFVEELRHMGGGNLSQGLLAMRVLVQRLAPAQTVTSDFVVPSAASKPVKPQTQAEYLHEQDQRWKRDQMERSHAENRVVSAEEVDPAVMRSLARDLDAQTNATLEANKAAYLHTDDPEVAAALADYADFRLTRSEPTKTPVTHPDIADGSDWG